MVTYASYLKRKTDLTGSGIVVAFANSSFEILAGIGVFAALGFMAQAQATEVAGVSNRWDRPRVHRLPDHRLASGRRRHYRRAVLRSARLRRRYLTRLGARGRRLRAARQAWVDARAHHPHRVDTPRARLDRALLHDDRIADTTDAFVNSFGIMAVAATPPVIVILAAARTAGVAAT